MVVCGSNLILLDQIASPFPFPLFKINSKKKCMLININFTNRTCLQMYVLSGQLKNILDALFTRIFQVGRSGATMIFTRFDQVKLKTKYLNAHLAFLTWLSERKRNALMLL